MAPTPEQTPAAGKGRFGWRWLKLLHEQLWEVEPDQFGWLGRRLIGGLRVFQLVWRGYRDDYCRLHASALTYYSLMSLVPLLALALALARVFGGDTIAQHYIQSEIAKFGDRLLAANLNSDGQEAALIGEFVERLNYYSDWLFQQIAWIGFGTLGGIGLIALLLMAISMLKQVEYSFNHIWNAPPRSLWRKFSDYLTIIIIVPFIILAATTIPVAGLVLRHLDGLLLELSLAAGGLLSAQQGASFFMTLLLFTTIFLFVPNTRVRLRPALLGGCVTALAFLVWLHICTALQVGVIKYSKLYGGLAILPILLAWVYTSWQIVLFGAELAFAAQYADTYGREQGARHAGIRARWQLALWFTTALARAMRAGTAPLHAVTFAHTHRISIRLLTDVINDLRQAHLIDESAAQPDHYLLRHDPATLTAATVVQAITGHGTPPENLGLGNLAPTLQTPLATAEAAWHAALATPIIELADQPPATATES